jgi:uncharacterized protein with NRDE domain
MCTITFIARKKGFAVGMNRDEKLAREPALPPSIVQTGDRRTLFPSERGGGTWIGVNDTGVCFALINWYAIAAQVAGRSVSRGEVVRSALGADSINDANKILGQLPLKRVNPFRLMGFFLARQEIIEWRWNSKKLEPLRHQWETETWISSGFDEPGAQQSRGKTFVAALRQPSVGERAWLRRLHRSHKPACGPYSTCMHREDAATVSYTEIIVSSREARMHYHAGPPCGHSKCFDRSLALAEAHAD